MSGSEGGAAAGSDNGLALPVGGSPAIASTEAADRVTAICSAVRQAVIEQRLPPGTKLPEDHLGAVFGASRTLVRAALQRLASDGMVRLTRNKGAHVASPTPREARELFDARRVVEAEIMSRAATRCRDPDVADLQALIRDGQRALAEGDRGRAIRLSGSFHLRVAEIAGQSVLTGFLAELVARSSLVIALYGHSGRSECHGADHAELILALQRGDPQAAATLMVQHLKHIEADLDLDRSNRPPASLAAALQVGPNLALAIV